jgi:hypothetical protein
MGPASDAPLSIRAGQWLTVCGSNLLLRPISSDAESTMKTSEVDLASDAGKP